MSENAPEETHADDPTWTPEQIEAMRDAAPSFQRTPPPDIGDPSDTPVIDLDDLPDDEEG